MARAGAYTSPLDHFLCQFLAGSWKKENIFREQESRKTEKKESHWIKLVTLGTPLHWVLPTLAPTMAQAWDVHRALIEPH